MATYVLASPLPQAVLDAIANVDRVADVEYDKLVDQYGLVNTINRLWRQLIRMDEAEEPIVRRQYLRLTARNRVEGVAAEASAEKV